jgi:hypothetical protein
MRNKEAPMFELPGAFSNLNILFGFKSENLKGNF